MYRCVFQVFKRVNLESYHIISSRYNAKDVRFGQTVRSQMLQGVDILADAVALTIGPKGRNVILELPYGPPKITKDGVTVAKGIELTNKFQNIGAKLVQNVAIKTNEEAGDGTSTATILARAIAKEGFENIAKGANPIEVRKGVMLAVEVVKNKLNAISKPINDSKEIEKIASLSSNGDEMVGKLITSAFDKVGKDGVVTIKSGKTLNDELEVVEGIQFDCGFVSPYFINSVKGPKVEYDEALVLFCQKKIFTIQQIIPTLEIAKLNKLPVIIIAEDIEEEPLSMLIVNKLKGGLPVVAVKAPSFGDNRKNTLMDMAVATGGVVFEDDLNLIRLEDCRLESLGKVGEVTITKDTTLLMKAKGDKNEIKQRIEEIEGDIDVAATEFDRIQLIERLSRLQSGVAVLHIGGYSEVEVNEKKDRINDALNATRAAISGGVVPGGGSAFVHCISALHILEPINADQATGVNIVMKALRTPCATIASNAGYDGLVVVSKIEQMENNFGFDAVRNEFVNMFETGIIDPTTVIKQALIDASGIASLLTTAEAVICDVVNEKKVKTTQ